MRSLCDKVHSAQRGACEIGRESFPGTLYLLLVITESQCGAVPHNQESIIKITHFLEEKLNYFDVGYKD